ncbi:sugar phosphorylase [Thermodesulfobacteriota bacterium]
MSTAFKKKRTFKTTETVHNKEPDYNRSLLKISSSSRKRLLKRLTLLYGERTAEANMPELERILQAYYAHKPLAMIERERDFVPENRFTEEDIILITYGDLVRGSERSPIATLAELCDTYLEGTVNTLHILPFFPYSSDKGFSITDFEEVDPRLGTWEDIEDLESRYQLMFDGVINHASSKSRWFQEFLNGNPFFWDFFIKFNSPDELPEDERKMIFRPRTSDILTEFQTINGPKWVWTTFSKDQVDLNYSNPDVLLKVIEILLLYVRHGADIIRLDAVTYLWAEPGTKCVHLEQTHEIVRLFRDILDIAAPSVALITETNVPHDENISYFGNGSDEAQMVYNFALPPLVLHTFYKMNSEALTNWAKNLQKPSDTATFFNFLDSHDGIGVMAVNNILNQDEIEFIVRKVQKHGGFISYKTAKDGTEIPYELNITWFSALNLVNKYEEDVAFQVKRFVASRSIALVIQGVPGIYFHSLMGSQNDIAAVISNNSKRDINRTVLDAEAIFKELENPSSKISMLSRELGRLIILRTRRKAFHPNSDQKVHMISSNVFALLRKYDEDNVLLAVTNITDKSFRLKIPLSLTGRSDLSWFDIVNQKEWVVEKKNICIAMKPYDIVWLEPYHEKADSKH